MLENYNPSCDFDVEIKRNLQKVRIRDYQRGVEENLNRTMNYFKFTNLSRMTLCPPL